MKILIADTYYPEFLGSIPFDAGSTYAAELRKVLDYKFGTFDAYATNLRKLGHECIDVIANHYQLQRLWAGADGVRDLARPFYYQTKELRPDVVFFQDLSLSSFLDDSHQGIWAGQLSCPWPGDGIVRRFDILYSSFPHYIPRIEALGVRAVYLPLAFEPLVLEGPQPERDIDISFVGGVGRDSHWKQGTDTLEIVAQAFGTRFQWFGYGADRLPEGSALYDCYMGPAWGRDMYQIYRRSKIVINRHGEVAQGYANNLRMFEATGCGALLFTEASRNLSELFVESNGVNYDPEVIPYESADEAVDIMWHFLNDNPLLKTFAANGQRRTLKDHTYAQRMKVVSETLMEMLGVGSLNKAGNHA